VDEQDPASIAKCIRKVSNMAVMKPAYIIDNKAFDSKMLSLVLPRAAPKIQALLTKIKELDDRDMRKEGKVYKHMIFSDSESSNHGAKLVASAMASVGFTPAFTHSLTMKSKGVLEETKQRNFGLLLSKPFAEKPMNTKFKKEMLAMYNERPDNIHGENIRFIILDQGFKEGIDLFDVKYVHLFEPLVSMADEKQAIGRGTRFCGQKGLVFHPRFGWPLYVFRYDIKFDEVLQGAQTMFELYLKYSDIDFRKVVFAAALEGVAIESAVDAELTHAIHSFRIDQPPPAVTPKLVASASLVGSPAGGAVTRSVTKSPVPPGKIMTFAQMQRYMQTFKRFKYPEAKLENKCVDGGPRPNGAGLLTFTPSQDFIRHYFQPSSAYKGLLVFHSVGTGKSCTGIATATTSFEKEGYTIMWVTRHTLKADIWKNMLVKGMSCHDGFREKGDAMKYPAKISSPMRYVSQQWIEPMSYRQFSNMLEKGNKFYEKIVAKNGEKDPLRKTLLIIDEAHKLYSPNVVGSEKADVGILEQWIDHSYKTSGKDSVRVMLMTATPYTDDGMEMVKLLNLLRADKLPTEFDTFSKKFLNDDGSFTKAGWFRFRDQISGYISYLNRSQDARNFSHPTIENILVPISKSGKEAPSKVHDEKIKDIAGTIKQLREAMKEKAAHVKEELAAVKKHCQEEQKERIADCKAEAKKDYDAGMERAKTRKATAVEKCQSLPVKERKGCKDDAQTTYTSQVDGVKEKKASKLISCNDLKETCAADKQERIAAVTKEVDDVKRKIQELKGEKGETRNILKEFREKNKEMMTNIKDFAAEIKNSRYELAGLKKRVEEAKAAAEADDSKAKKDELKKARADVKKATQRIKDLRADSTKLRNTKLAARLEVGRGSIGDVSVETALNKKCLKTK
jgi:hypothetical protein